jgi:hypothetical protein
MPSLPLSIPSTVTRVHTTMLVELVASRQIWITKRVAAILPANL